MFAPQKPSTATVAASTKIPVPSPTPLRRSASLRIRGEVAASRASNPSQRQLNNPCGGGGGGGAFMEAARSRPTIKTTAATGASPRVPQSPARNRSLVSERGEGRDGVGVLIWK